jgi:hypothetical protein
MSNPKHLLVLLYSIQTYLLDFRCSLFLILPFCRDSLLEDLPRNEDVHKSFGFTPESQSLLLSANCLSMDMTFDSLSNSSDKHGKGSSKYLKTHAFSPSVGWEKGEVDDSSFIPCNSEQRDFLPVKVRFSIRLLILGSEGLLVSSGVTNLDRELLVVQLEHLVSLIPFSNQYSLNC